MTHTERSFFAILLVASSTACTPPDTVARDDASTADAPVADAAPDAPASDVAPDARPDATPDASPDATADASPDATADASLDGAVMCGNVSMPTNHLCAPAAPTAEPGCRCVIGAYWNGSACAFLGGCRCLTGCDQVYPTQEACESAHRACRPDAGGGVDAGGTFACGPSLRCGTARESCHETIPGVPGAMRSYRCAALPMGCSRCACVPEASMPGAVCQEPAPGEITVRVALP